MSYFILLALGALVALAIADDGQCLGGSSSGQCHVGSAGHVDLQERAGERLLEQQAAIRKQHKKMQAGCTDARPDCEEQVGSDLIGCKKVGMLKDCKHTCLACRDSSIIDAAATAKDSRDECEEWAANGECDENPGFMHTECRHSCKVGVLQNFYCDPYNNTPAAVGPNGIRNMFMRALSEFPQYRPKMLSVDPLLLEFENLLGPAEAAEVIKCCPESSEWFGSLTGSGSHRARTSSQCWCKTPGQNDESKALIKRMADIMMVDWKNLEDLQILQYEQGQFYQVHHDSITAHFTPMGVRLFTFYVYLSDVEEGGGTRFPYLNLTVSPKVGHAILWPNVIEYDAMTKDIRTSHEALEVTKGIKYGANLWAHKYDFISASRASSECHFMGKATGFV